MKTPLENGYFHKLEKLYDKFGKNHELKAKTLEEEKNKKIDELEDEILAIMKRKEKILEEFNQKVKDISTKIESITILQTISVQVIPRIF